jgi:RNA polymerase sigma factor (sigma-70 family)
MGTPNPGVGLIPGPGKTSFPVSGNRADGQLIPERVSTDHQLLRAYVDGRDEAAFAELVQRHAGVVYASAMRQTCDPSKAEDVVQAVFILLSRKGASLSESVPLGAWLFRAASYAAKDLMKAERRRVQRDQIAYSMNPIDKTPPADRGDEDLWERISPVLDDCLSRMPESDRRAILLRFFEEKSLAEVGSALGIAEDAARKRVSRAITRLRELLSRRGAEIGEADLVPVLGRAAAFAPAGLAAATVAAVLGSTPKASAAALSVTVGRQLAWAQWRWWVAAGSAAVVGGTTAHLATRDSAPAAVVRPAADSDDYSVAGFPKAAQVHDFIQELQARTSVRDAAGVARLIGFPLRVNRSGQPTQIADAAEFTAAFDTLFPQSVAGMVLKCPRSRLFASSQGVMIGTGEVWIAPREAADGSTVPRIIAINIE